VAATEGLSIAGTRVQVLVSSHDTGGRYAVCEVEIAGSNGPPLHSHRYEDGFFYILEGEFDFQIDGKAATAGPGTSLFIPRQTAYAFRSKDDKGRLLVLAHPGGLDLFFQDVKAVAQGQQPVLEKLVTVLDKHGIVISPKLESG
jgi:quercetin dioxygenase-like cupin family protein